MRRRVIPALLVLGALLSWVLGTFATSAIARQAARGTQKEQILRAAGFSRHAPSSCYVVYLSTVNRNWATATYGGSTRQPCARYGSNGVVVVHYRAGKWHLVTEGSAFSCPIPGHIPTAVQHDLKLSCVHGAG
jgi:membrane protein YqaA with SNARE-associated domain